MNKQDLPDAAFNSASLRNALLKERMRTLFFKENSGNFLERWVKIAGDVMHLAADELSSIRLQQPNRLYIRSIKLNAPLLMDEENLLQWDDRVSDTLQQEYNNYSKTAIAI